MIPPQLRIVLAAVCSRLVPSAFANRDGDAFIEAVEARIDGLPESMRRDVLGLLRLFDSAALRFMLMGRAGPFHAAGPAQQDAWLRLWRGSRIPRLRTGYQALHRLVFFTHYASDSAATEIGARPPLVLRPRTEGPLKGAPKDDEPILRVAELSRWQAQTPPSRLAPYILRDATHGARVCVIGSGAGGAVIACRLAEAGHDVVILEEGGLWESQDFTERENEMVPRLFAEQGAQATEDLSYTLLQGRCAGGGTTVNWLIMLRPRAEVMDDWQRTRGAEMLAAALLVPALERIEEETHAHLVPPDAHNTPNRLLLEGCDRLGWRSEPARINTRDCVRAGACGLGCRHGARQGSLTVYLPRAIAAGARLVTDTRAQRITRSPTGIRIDAVRQPDSAPVTIECDHVVLAAGAIGTPTLLLRSGLGGPAVGRYLRLHPTTAVFGVHARDVLADGGIPQSAVCTQFENTNGGYGLWIECPPWYAGTLAAAYTAPPAEHRAFMESFPRCAPLIVLVRDGASGQSQGDVRIDRSGRVRVRYRTGAAERARLAEGIAAAVRIQLAAGATEVHTLLHDVAPLRSATDLGRIAARFAPNRAGLFSAHLNGTCRMGRDARTSGCDPSGLLHGTKDVWVADGSLFPTAPGVNPQATIMALASLVAERLHERLAR
jgi:choline dehydrogenase-like flavoprotein